MAITRRTQVENKASSFNGLPDLGVPLTLVFCLVLACARPLPANSYKVGFGSLFGGNQWERIQSVCTDAAGDIYVTGSTKSGNLHTTAGAFDTKGSAKDQNDGFVAKLTSDGSQILWSTYLHGSDRDDIYGIQVGADGFVYLTGWTRSTDFPTTRYVYDRSHNGKMDVFVAKLKPDGSGLVYCTLLGGSGTDQCRGAIHVDATGAVTFSGYTDSRNFPATPGAVQHEFQGGYGDAFVAKLSPDGVSLDFATYLGSSGPDHAFAGLAVHADGSIVTTGAAGAADFPVTSNAFQSGFGGNAGHGVWNGDAFVARFELTPENQAVVHYISFIGGSADEKSTAQHGLVLDAHGNVYISGTTHSSDFPTTPGVFQQNLKGNNNLFVSKISADGSTLLASTFLGGTVDGGYETSGMVIDALGQILVSGSIFGTITDHPVSPGAFQPQAGGGSGEAFFTALSSDLSMIRYASFLGGSEADRIRDLALLPSGDVVVAGDTHSRDFPTTPGVFHEDYANAGDAHVVRLNRTDSLITVDPSITFELNDVRVCGTFCEPNALGVAVHTEDTQLAPLAFVNIDGDHVVVVRAGVGRNLLIQGLPAGTYGTSYILGDSTNAVAVRETDLPDQSILSGQGLATALPGEGVLTVYAKTPSEDKQPPSVPADLTIESLTFPPRTLLRWEPSTDNVQLVGYQILRDGIDQGFSLIPSFVDVYINPDLGFIYQIFAVDLAGNRSDPLVFENKTTEVPNLAGGLLGHWPFDGNQRTTVVDISGANRNGSLLGPTRTVGFLDRGLDFDGSNDHVRIVNDPALHNLSAVTMTAWIYPRQDNHGHVLDKGDGDKRLLLKGANRQLMGLVRYSSGPVSTSESSANTLILDFWQHVALTWTRSDNLIRLYHNGAEVTYAKQQIGSGTVRDDTSHPYMIGIRSNLGMVNAFNGIIDEVRLYGRAVSETEIRAIYESGL